MRRWLAPAIAIFLFLGPIDCLAQLTSDSSRAEQGIKIKGDDIRRNATTNFLEAVNGLYPWIFTPHSTANDFNFVVNGFLLKDINSISLNDIEEVYFTRENLNGQSFPFSKPGTFYIVTRKASQKLELQFNTQAGVFSSGRKSFTLRQPNGNEYARVSPETERAGFYNSNHFSIGSGGKNYSVNFSAQAIFCNSPRQKELTEYSNLPSQYSEARFHQKIPDQRFHLNASYRFSEKVEASVSADYSHLAVNRDTTTLSNSFGVSTDGTTSSETSLSYHDLGLSVGYKPLKNLSNRFWVEYAFDTIFTPYSRLQNYVNSSGQPSWNRDSSVFTAENKRFFLRDQVTYAIQAGKLLHLDLSVTATYLNHKASDAEFRAFSSGPVVGSSGWGYSWYRQTQKFGSVNPAFDFSLKDIISAYAGASFLIGKKTLGNLPAKEKRGYYAGVAFHLASLLKPEKRPGQLSLAFDYGDLPQNNSTHQWLGGEFDYWSGFSGTTLGGYFSFSDPGGARLLANRFVSGRLKFATKSQRFHLTGEWSRLEKERVITINNGPWAPPSFILATERAEGFSFLASADWLRGEYIKWYSRLSLLFPKTKLELPLTANPAVANHSSVQSGLFNRFEYKKIFLVVSLLADIGHESPAYSPISGFTSEKENEFVINSLQFGFSPVSGRRGVPKNLTLFLQCRNLVNSREVKRSFADDPFYGVGANLGF